MLVKLARSLLVNLSLMGRAVGEFLKDATNSRRFNTIVSTVAAFCAVVGVFSVLSGWLSTNAVNQNDLRTLLARMDRLSEYVLKLSSNQDRRMDDLDNRLRAVEEHLARVTALTEQRDQERRNGAR